MSENNKQTTTTTTKKSHTASWILNFVGFVAVICVGISMLLGQFKFMGEVAGAFAIIAQCISYIILIALSTFYVVRRRKIWIWVVWAISVALIIVTFFLGVF